MGVVPLACLQLEPFGAFARVIMVEEVKAAAGELYKEAKYE